MAENPVEIGAITEALNNKTDTDVQNTNTIGSAQIAHFAMPSSKYIDFTVTSGMTYTAPEDGYVLVRGTSQATTVNYVQVTGLDKPASDGGVAIVGNRSDTYNVGQSCTASIPVFKGMPVDIYVYSVTNIQGRFVYAKGSEPQS